MFAHENKKSFTWHEDKKDKNALVKVGELSTDYDDYDASYEEPEEPEGSKVGGTDWGLKVLSTDIFKKIIEHAEGDIEVNKGLMAIEARVSDLEERVAEQARVIQRQAKELKRLKKALNIPIKKLKKNKPGDRNILV